MQPCSTAAPPPHPEEHRGPRRDEEAPASSSEAGASRRRDVAVLSRPRRPGRWRRPAGRAEQPCPVNEAASTPSGETRSLSRAHPTSPNAYSRHVSGGYGAVGSGPPSPNVRCGPDCPPGQKTPAGAVRSPSGSSTPAHVATVTPAAGRGDRPPAHGAQRAVGVPGEQFVAHLLVIPTQPGRRRRPGGRGTVPAAAQGGPNDLRRHIRAAERLGPRQWHTLKRNARSNNVSGWQEPAASVRAVTAPARRRVSPTSRRVEPRRGSRDTHR